MKANTRNLQRPIIPQNGHYICTCCGAQADTEATIEHDDCCAWGNTVEALLEFIPNEFLLGGEKEGLCAPALETIAALGFLRYNEIDQTTKALLVNTPEEERAAAVVTLSAEAPTLFKLLNYLAKHPIEEETLRRAVRNYVCFDIVAHRALETSADALNRALARHDTVTALFTHALSTAYNIPERVL